MAVEKIEGDEFQRIMKGEEAQAVPAEAETETVQPEEESAPEGTEA